MIPILPAASLLVPALIGLAGGVLQIHWGSLESSDSEGGKDAADGLGSKLAGTKVASTVQEKVTALDALFASPDFKGLTRRVDAKGKELRQYVSGALDSFSAAGSPGPKSRAVSPADASLAAECERALGDLDLFLGIAGMIAGAKQAALIARNSWVAEAEGLETVINEFVGDMADADASLQEVLKEYDPRNEAIRTLAKARIQRLRPGVTNTQSAAVSRMNSLKDVLQLGVEGIEPLLMAAKAACAQFPEPGATSLTSLNITRSTLDGWVVLVVKDMTAAKKAYAALERAAAPFLGQNLFEHLESFRPYKLEHVTKALDDAERAFD